MRRRTGLLVVAALAIAAAAVVAASSEILVDWLWFRSLGFGAVFATVWCARVAAFAVAATASWLILVASGLLAARAPAPLVRRLRLVRASGDPDGMPETLEISFERIPWRLVVLAAATLLSVFVGLAYAGSWEDVLKWWYAVPFERVDPLFGRDLAFYVFTLPVWRAACDWGLLIIVLAALATGAVYWGRGAIEVGGGPPRLAPAPMRHLSILLAAFSSSRRATTCSNATRSC